MPIELGIVADDFTGAVDVAATVTADGLPAAVLLDVPADAAAVPDLPCVVVALKSRTAPVTEAVAQSVTAARTLREAGAARIYQKYCSTFDSTDTGNIGPVADALMDELGAETNLTTPATPAAGRTVYRGHLFVGDRLLSESSLRDHPLTPMTDPDLVRVLGRQAARPVSRGAEAAGHVLLDATSEPDLDRLAALLLDRADVGRVDLWGGAAGLAGAIARATGTGATYGERADVPTGARLVVSGSCSERTRAQIQAFPGPAHQIEPGRSDAAVDFLTAAFADDPDRPALVHSGSPAGRPAPGAAADVETTLAEVAATAVAKLGVGQLLVAGGETSGAVCRALGLRALDVREPVGTGLAWCSPRPDPGLRVLLKSGNFGGDGLFGDAWL